jgi:hypothetical protein
VNRGWVGPRSRFGVAFPEAALQRQQAPAPRRFAIVQAIENGESAPWRIAALSFG